MHNRQKFGFPSGDSFGEGESERGASGAALPPDVEKYKQKLADTLACNDSLTLKELKQSDNLGAYKDWLFKVVKYAGKLQGAVDIDVVRSFEDMQRRENELLMQLSRLGELEQENKSLKESSGHRLRSSPTGTNYYKPGANNEFNSYEEREKDTSQDNSFVLAQQAQN